MTKLFNLARMSTATTGTGTITLGSAATGFLSFASAGVGDGDTVTYAIEDGNNREIGRGVYTSSGTTLTRSVLRSTNSNSAINLSGAAEVFITASAEDFKTLTQPTLDGTTTLSGTPSGAFPHIGALFTHTIGNAGGPSFGMYMAQTMTPASGSDAYFQYAGGTVNTANGTIASASGLFTSALAKSGSNNITTVYGARFTVQTVGVTNWSMYSEGNALFGGATKFSGISTTASAANAYLDSGDFNNILRSTSSLAYKDGVELIDPSIAARVLDLEPIWYRSKAAADRHDWSWYGLGAEQVAEIDPRLVHWGYHADDYEVFEVPHEFEIDGELRTVMTKDRRLKAGAVKKPDGVMYDRIGVLLLAWLKNERIPERLAAIEQALGQFYDRVSNP